MKSVSPDLELRCDRECILGKIGGFRHWLEQCCCRCWSWPYVLSSLTCVNFGNPGQIELYRRFAMSHPRCRYFKCRINPSQDPYSATQMSLTMGILPRDMSKYV
jgi:hypothetical protein